MKVYNWLIKFREAIEIEIERNDDESSSSILFRCIPATSSNVKKKLRILSAV